MKLVLAPALLVLLATACGTYTTSERNHRDGNRAYSASAPRQGEELICHKGKKTMSLPSSAVDAHLGHGDRRGRC